MAFRTGDVKRYITCPKLFLMASKETEKTFPFVYFNESVTDAAIKFMNIDLQDAFIGSANETTKDSLKGMEGKTWAICPRFEEHNFRSKPAILKREEEGWHYYAINRINFPKEEDAKRLYMDKWLMEEAGLHITNISLIHPNASYVFEDQLDYKNLFIISEEFYKDVNKKSKNVFETVNKIDIDMMSALNDMTRILETDTVDTEFHLECTKRGKCDYYHSCFNEDELEDNSILFLTGTRKKYDMFKAGIKTINELTFDGDVDGTYIQWAQYMSAVTGKPYMDYNGLSTWMKSHFKKPFAYVDFEWDTYGFPMYRGMKPYDVLLFQYSLDIEHEDGTIEHKDFLGKNGDCRRDFIESLIHDMPKEGSIFAFNGDSAEVLRLKECIEQFPEYEEPLQDIISRMVDLTYPINQGAIYLPKMRGTFSLKKILEVIEPDNSYSRLDIHHGLQAAEAYRVLPTMSDEEKEKTIKDLLVYCGMDTYSMIVFVRYLYKLIGEY